MERSTAGWIVEFVGKPIWFWLLFIGIVTALLALDLGVLHKDDHAIGIRESLWLSAGQIGVALLFGTWAWSNLGAQSGTEYFTGYLIEKSLSMDNVFVIALIFGYFAIPAQYQHHVWFWGILGVIILRAIMTQILEMCACAGDRIYWHRRQDSAGDIAQRYVRLARCGCGGVAGENARRTGREHNH